MIQRLQCLLDVHLVFDQLKQAKVIHADNRGYIPAVFSDDGAFLRVHDAIDDVRKVLACTGRRYSR